MRILVSLASFGLLGLGFWLLHAREAETATATETETATATATATATQTASMVVPRYDASGAMLRPEGYRSWVFVGASLGLRYADDAPAPADADDGPGTFHNVYIQPEAFQHYVETGTFPEKTILPMETYETGTREPQSELTGGFFEADFSGLSAAVKDKERFPEGWGYVTFRRDGGPMRDAAEPFAKERCYDCHLEHGATDNVFTQFYPILRDAR